MSARQRAAAIIYYRYALFSRIGAADGIRRQHWWAAFYSRPADFTFDFAAYSIYSYMPPWQPPEYDFAASGRDGY